MIERAWWWIEPLIKRLCRRTHGELSAAALKGQAVSGSLLIWVVTSPAQTPAPLALLITRFVDWGEPVCRVIGAAGALKSLAEMWDKGEARIKALGMKRIVFEGRLGWRLLQKRGYRETAVVMEKRLDG